MRDFWIRNLHLLKHVVFEIWPLYGKVNVQTSKYLRKLLGRCWRQTFQGHPSSKVIAQNESPYIIFHLSVNLHPKPLSVGLVSPKNVGDRHAHTQSDPAENMIVVKRGNYNNARCGHKMFVRCVHMYSHYFYLYTPNAHDCVLVTILLWRGL